MTDPTGTDAAKPATVFVTTDAGTVCDRPTGTNAAAPATRFVVMGPVTGTEAPPRRPPLGGGSAEARTPM
jgi:hypothetical protein